MKLKILLIFFLSLTFMACKVQKTSTTETLKPIHLDKKTFIEKVWNYEKDEKFNYKGDKPAIIDFYADWCGPCKRIAPILNELQKEYGNKLIIYKVNTEHNRQLAGLFQVRSIPALLFIPVVAEPRMAVGSRSKSQFKKIIKDILLIDEPVEKTK